MNTPVFTLFINLFVTLTTVITASFFFSLFSTAVPHPHRRVLTVALTLFAFLLGRLCPITPVRTAVLILSTLLLSFNYRMKLYNRLLFTLIFVVFNGLIEVITTLFVLMTFSIGIEDTLQGAAFAFGAVVSKLLVSVFLLAVASIKKNDSQGRLQQFTIFAMPASSFVITWSLFYSVKLNEGSTVLIMASLIGLIMLVFINMLVFKMLETFRRTALQDARLKTADTLIESQKKQYALLCENNETVIKLRHDRKNFTMGLLSMLERGETGKARDLLREELSSLSLAADAAPTAVSELDSLVSYKRSEYAPLGINIELEHRNAQKMRMSGVDVFLLLGNAVDNAAEALLLLPDGEDKTVRIKILASAEQTLITVTNRVVSSVDPESLKSSKGDMHGYGIISMKAIVEKYGGDIFFSCDNNVFKMTVLL